MVKQSRRTFLSNSAETLGTAALLSLLANDGLAAGAPTAPTPQAPHFEPRARNCIFIFLAGGMSHIELFDPKPELAKHNNQRAPESFLASLRPDLKESWGQRVLMGSRYGYRRYGRSGMELSELLPQIGSCADDIALIRSLHHHNPDHAQSELLLSSGVDLAGRPSAGAWLHYGLGSESRDLPGYVVLLNERGPLARELVWGSGCLPRTHRGVLFRSQGEAILNLKHPADLPRSVERRRFDAVHALNALRQDRVGDPRIAERIQAYELAFRLQRAAPELIDLSRESRRTLEDYGVERDGQDGMFSRNCLLARRMVERGVRFVTVLQSAWDHHKEIAAGLRKQCRQVDQPIATLLRDLKERGMLDSTLVVCATEFGRTPITDGSKTVEAKSGRGHHPHGFSSWMAGAGIRGGQVIGKTDELGWHAVEDRMHVHDFNATLLHLFGLDHTQLTFPSQGLDVRLTDLGGDVVTKLLEA